MRRKTTHNFTNHNCENGQSQKRRAVMCEQFAHPMSLEIIRCDVFWWRHDRQCGYWNKIWRSCQEALVLNPTTTVMQFGFGLSSVQLAWLQVLMLNSSRSHLKRHTVLSLSASEHYHSEVDKFLKFGGGTLSIVVARRALQSVLQRRNTIIQNHLFWTQSRYSEATLR